MELSNGKLLAAVTLSIMTFVFTMLPLVLARKFQRNSNGSRYFRVMSFLSCFGGGVFMATCLLHLFPDVQSQIELVFKNLHLDPRFPVAEFLLSCGFLIVMITEQIVLTFEEHNTHEKLPIINNQHSHIETQYQNYGSVNEHLDPQSHNGLLNEDITSSLSKSAIEQNVHDEPHTHEISFHQDLSSHSILRSLLLIFALSLHSIFEGLAIGLQSTTENVIKIFLAVLIHKCIIALTLGLNLTHSKLNKSSIIKGNIFFSLTSPIGIIIGVVVVDFVTGLPMLITSSVLQGLAAGTFLYVTFFEVLPHELNSNENRMIKMICLLLGFSLVSVLLIVVPD